MKFLAPPVALVALTIFTATAAAFQPTIALQSKDEQQRSERRAMFQKMLESKMEGLDGDRRLQEEPDFIASIWGEVSEFLPDREDLNDLFGWGEDDEFSEAGDQDILFPDSDMPSDMPSMMPSDMPSLMPSDMPSLSGEPWEAAGNEIATDSPPNGDEAEADSVTMPNNSEEARSASGGGNDDRSLALPLALGLGAGFVALVAAFVVYRMRRSSHSSAFVETGEDTPMSNSIALEEGVTPRAPSPVNASNQFDGTFSDTGPSASLVSKSVSAELSNYQMSEIGQVDSNRSSLLDANLQVSNTATL